MALSPSPGEHHRDHGEAARPQSQPTRKSMLEMAEAQIAARERNPSLVRHEFQTKRSPDGVFKVFLQEQKLGRAKPVVLIAAKSQRAVDVLSSKRLLKVKRHRVRS